MRTKKIISFLVLMVMLITSMSVPSFAISDFIYVNSPSGNADEIYVIDCTPTAIVDGVLTIPSKIDGKKVTGINSGAFIGSMNITSVIIPETVSFIGKKAFAGCENIKDITIKNKECNISGGVFSDSLWWKNQPTDYVIIEDTLIAYKGNDSKVYVPYNIRKIGMEAFSGNKSLTEIYISDEIKEVGEKAFAGCSNLESIIIPETCHIEKIGGAAFENTKWLNEYDDDFVIVNSILVRYKGAEKQVRIPYSVTEISPYAFATNNANVATRIIVPYSVSVFNDECFYLRTAGEKIYPYIYAYKGSPTEKYIIDNKIGDYYLLATPGDVNLDNKVTTSDAKKILRVVSKLDSPFNLSASYGADVNNDTKVNTVDAKIVLRIVAKINEFTAEEYKSMPKTGYETLAKVKELLLKAQSVAGYEKYAYQKITSTDINLLAKNKLDIICDNLTSEQNAIYKEFESGTLDSAKNIYASTLVKESMINSYSCKYDGSKYLIQIILKDETVSSKGLSNGNTAKLFPVATVSDFKNIYAQKGRYDMSSPTFDFDVTYKNCILSLRADAKTGSIEELSYDMDYEISFKGKVGNTEIKGDSKNGNATITRHDKAYYNNFNYLTF